MGARWARLRRAPARRRARRRAAHEVAAARTSAKPQRPADEGDDRADQEDLVEAADEGLIGGSERVVAGPGGATAPRPPGGSAPDATASAEARGRLRQVAASSRAIRDWKIAPSAATPVAIPTWRKVDVDPRRHAGSAAGGTTPIAVWAIAGLVMPDARRRHTGSPAAAPSSCRRPRTPCIKQQADADERSDPPRAGPGSGQRFRELALRSAQRRTRAG